MQPTDSLETRKEMVAMHNEYINRLDTAIKNEQFVEAAWLCYAIFEQRVNRLIIKFICKCPKEEKTKGNPVSITTRIKCLQKLIKANYGGFEFFDAELLNQILEWCHKRNNLVHGLISLDHYKKFDEEFKELAICGKTLVSQIYEENTKYRNWFMAVEELPSLPADYKGCKNNQKCLKTPI